MNDCQIDWDSADSSQIGCFVLISITLSDNTCGHRRRQPIKTLNFFTFSVSDVMRCVIASNTRLPSPYLLELNFYFFFFFFFFFSNNIWLNRGLLWWRLHWLFVGFDWVKGCRLEVDLGFLSEVLGGLSVVDRWFGPLSTEASNREESPGPITIDTKRSTTQNICTSVRPPTLRHSLEESLTVRP